MTTSFLWSTRDQSVVSPEGSRPSVRGVSGHLRVGLVAEPLGGARMSRPHPRQAHQNAIPRTHRDVERPSAIVDREPYRVIAIAHRLLLLM